MIDSPIFDWICQALERATSFSEIEARGTIRISLKKAGLEACSVTAAQMQVVVKRALPAELTRRGVDDSQPVCDGLATQLKNQRFEQAAHTPDTPETVFARLGS